MRRSHSFAASTGLLVLVCVALFQIFPATVHAAKPVYVPDQLEPWKDWVLEGLPDLRCPFLGQVSNKTVPAAARMCAWSSPLDLKADSRGATFDQRWTLYDEEAIPLPGDSEHWPLEVKVNGRPTPVSQRGGVPTLLLKKGEHRISGAFQWSALPKWLTLPSTTGLVRLSMNGKDIPFPQFNNNRIGLALKQMEGAQAVQESLQIKVFRKISEGIPLTVEARMVLDVSGPGREVLLGRALFKNHIPTNLQSPLPVRLESDGRLRLQVKPGHWVVSLLSRHNGPVSEIRLDPSDGPWAEEEIWSYQADTNLRLTELSGLNPIDPQQSGVPDEWKQLPAFRVVPGSTLKITEKRRGNSEPATDALHLNRQIWFDFNGKGYTIKDQITGTMNQGWRLDLNPAAVLGRVNVDGRDQLITYAKDGLSAGVEIRQGRVNISAVSRVEEGNDEFNAVGWKHDFQSLKASLYLPPGYKLFTATGLDRASPSWISQWSLFDLFILLIITAAVSNLRGRKWGIVAFFTLGLIYHESGAPVFVWLNIAASLALLNVLPSGRFRTAVAWYRNLSFAALVVISLPFMIGQARQSIYPQLEHHRAWITPSYQQGILAPKKVDRLEKKSKERRNAPMEMEADEAKPRSSVSKYYSRGRLSDFKSVDPDALIQTGPGLPGWQWNPVHLYWSGPVGQEETVKLYLIPPAVNAVLGFMRIALIVALVVGLLNIPWRPGRGFSLPGMKPVSAALLLFAFMNYLVPSAVADIPDPNLLGELKQRLLAPPECGKDCFDIQRARVDVEKNELALRLETHVLENMALPLPGRRGQWMPRVVLVDGKPARELLRSPGQPGVWLHLPPGIHQITLSGPLPQNDSVQVFFPRKPHKVEIHLQGWEAEGIRDHHLLNNSLQLTRVRSKSQTDVLRSDAPPAFVQVDRVLRLGLNWQVETRVTRVAPKSGAINLEVPLLPGESVLSEHVKLTGDHAIVSLGAGMNQTRWLSTLEKTDSLTLAASKNSHWVEQWTIDASTLHHVDYEGLPPIIQQSRGKWKPQFRPWPGETLLLTITRPKAVPGSTLAIDGAEMTVTPGARVTRSELKLNLRSSRGGQHAITLPEGTELETVLLNGATQPIRMEGRTVTLPLKPGKQDYLLKFKTRTGVTTRTVIPEVDLGQPAANISVTVRVPRNRWMLFVDGPRMGPAVLFWGELIVVLLLALALGRTSMTPLKTHHWILLGIAMSTIAVTKYLLVVAWLFALAKRRTLETGDYSRTSFNLMQAALGLLTLFAVVSLFTIIPTGLLGAPDMHVVGNNSSAHLLHWYQDRVAGPLPSAWFVSVPLGVYRMAILLWALWMAFALLKWLRWGWECFSHEGIWRSKSKVLAPKTSEV